MSFKENLENDTVFDQGKIKSFIKPRNNLYFRRHYVGIRKGKDKFSTIGQIVRRWGYDYLEVVKQMDKRTKNGQIGIVQYSGTEEALKRNMNRQKYLDFAIFNAKTGNIVFNGAIVFEKGKMSFNT